MICVSHHACMQVLSLDLALRCGRHITLSRRNLTLRLRRRLGRRRRRVWSRVWRRLWRRLCHHQAFEMCLDSTMSMPQQVSVSELTCWQRLGPSRSNYSTRVTSLPIIDKNFAGTSRAEDKGGGHLPAILSMGIPSKCRWSIQRWRWMIALKPTLGKQPLGDEGWAKFSTN